MSQEKGSMSSGYVSITDFGAVGDGKTDNQNAIQKAFDYAKAHGVAVFVPQGVFNHSGTLTANGISVYWHRHRLGTVWHRSRS
jgi:polygalacturonase